MTPIDGDLNITKDNAPEILQRDEFKDITKEELQILLEAKTGSEFKEVVNKSLEFEEDTFKIDSTGRKEATDKNDLITGKFVDKGIRVKVHPKGDVVECLEDKGDCKKGEQMFIGYASFVKYVAEAKKCTVEEVESKYLMTVDELKEKMKDKPNDSEEYKKFFNQEIKSHLVGDWNPNIKLFCNSEMRSRIWLVGGNNGDFYNDGWRLSSAHRHFGFSGRLLKN